MENKIQCLPPNRAKVQQLKESEFEKAMLEFNRLVEKYSQKGLDEIKFQMRELDTPDGCGRKRLWNEDVLIKVGIEAKKAGWCVWEHYDYNRSLGLWFTERDNCPHPWYSKF